MKIRGGFVSNSSSTSFLVPHEVDGRITSLKLPEEIWKAIAENGTDMDGNKIDLSASNEWWLTEMVSDCLNEYEEISKMDGAMHYLDGNDSPYGWYDDDSEKYYTVFKKREQKYYVLTSDLIGADGKADIPGIIKVRDDVIKIMFNKSLNKSQKLNIIKRIFDF